MHTWYYRLNALVSWVGMFLALIMALNYITGRFDMVYPDIDISVSDINLISNPNYDEDLALVYLNIKGDLSPVFNNWSVKLIFLYITVEYRTPQNRVNKITIYDKIINETQHASLDLSHVNDYPIIEASKALKGGKLSIRLNYDIVPQAGLLTQYHAETVLNVTLPTTYTPLQRRSRF
mmetsp:Transcript_22757/g.63993  ORF Transcript_22757/g.63993 Transcript_22757/m.63993 type:complete len:178 (+) Transcript_22757:96-629(+)